MGLSGALLTLSCLVFVAFSYAEDEFLMPDPFCDICYPAMTAGDPCSTNASETCCQCMPGYTYHEGEDVGICFFDNSTCAPRYAPSGLCRHFCISVHTVIDPPVDPDPDDRYGTCMNCYTDRLACESDEPRIHVDDRDCYSDSDRVYTCDCLAQQQSAIRVCGNSSSGGSGQNATMAVCEDLRDECPALGGNELVVGFECVFNEYPLHEDYSWCRSTCSVSMGNGVVISLALYFFVVVFLLL